VHPLLNGFESDSVLAWRSGERLTAATALAAAHRLAVTMPRARYAINLCDSLDTFIVATLATWIARRTIILPPTRLPRATTDLRARHPDSFCLVDMCGDVGPTVAVAKFIDDAVAEAGVAVMQWPMLADDHEAAVLFTSGSTGTPRPQAKSFGELVRGAVAFTQSIGTPHSVTVILGTVPPQHMFGFETTVMLPLQSGAAVITARPAFPADLADALAQARTFAPDGVWLMTTPLQLRAFHRERPKQGGLAEVIVSTMPLDADLACAIERDWKVRVTEIYGCTEGGLLAVRRTSNDAAWTPASSLTFTIEPDGEAHVTGGHVRGRLDLADRLRSADNGRSFELIGRLADMVKIAGKRASLSGLTRELLAIPGVQDGVVFLATPDAQRVAAVAVAPGVALADLRRAFAQRVDPAFVPRPFVLADALPRNPAGKLAADALRKAIARNVDEPGIDASERRRQLTTQLSYARDHPCLPGHFPGNPVIPGTLLLASVENLLLRSNLRIVECTQAKFLAPVLPEQPLTIRVDLVGNTQARFEIASSSRIVAAGTLRCADEMTRP
jgi:acyl-coenzyme A synthetase/AMP-(fatty) acid ligase/3-hydroxymyristoyl/3-hydroxydecanoyl-(acyl carrier protein) dehydratase